MNLYDILANYILIQNIEILKIILENEKNIRDTENFQMKLDEFRSTRLALNVKSWVVCCCA